MQWLASCVPCRNLECALRLHSEKSRSAGIHRSRFTMWLQRLICTRNSYPGAKVHESCGVQMTKWRQNWRLVSSCLLKDIYLTLSWSLQASSRYSHNLSTFISVIFFENSNSLDSFPVSPVIVHVLCHGICQFCHEYQFCHIIYYYTDFLAYTATLQIRQLFHKVLYSTS